MPGSRNTCVLLTAAWMLSCAHTRADRHSRNIPRQSPAGVSDTTGQVPANTDCNDPPFCQEPDQGNHGGFALVHSDALFGSSGADGFTLAVPEQIDRVRWWGGYLDVAGVPAPCATILDDDFTLTIHTDDGGQPGAIVSSNLLASSAPRMLTGNQISWFGDLFDEYEYTADLLQPFVASAGQTYWVVIEQLGTIGSCTWWWETAPQGAFGDGSTLWDQNGGGYLIENFDLAFCINPIMDCNGNDVCDSLDIQNGPSLDCNATDIPDECENIALGDFNVDGAVRLDDYQSFAACMAGPTEPPIPELLECAAACLAAFDFGIDGTIDLRDFALLQRGLSVK